MSIHAVLFIPRSLNLLNVFADEDEQVVGVGITWNSMAKPGNPRAL